MLSEASVRQVLESLPRLHIGVLGDLFLDRYLDLDARLTEPSLETGLDAYQVVRVRAQPGAAGTVINNLMALGAKNVSALSIIGQDGEGYELEQALQRLGVNTAGLIHRADRRTPTYTKPMLQEPGRPARELNRLDIKNRQPLPRDVEAAILAGLEAAWPALDALIVSDQVSEPDCGVITAGMRSKLADLGRRDPKKPVLVDSRERIGLFEAVSLKPNEIEACKAIPGSANSTAAARELARRARRPIFCTRGERGTIVVMPDGSLQEVPAYRVEGPIDIVGAGDSTNAGLASAVAAGVSLPEAAAFGNLVASITIQQLGTTGTASPEQVWQRWREMSA